MKILDLFLFLWVIFALLDPDPDPATQINADPCESGSKTLEKIRGPSTFSHSHQKILICCSVASKQYVFYVFFYLSPREHVKSLIYLENEEPKGRSL
jgi:hypothetical protein